MKQYKPGQFVSIDGKRARVCKHSSLSMSVCDQCRLANGWEIKDYYSPISCRECLQKLGRHLYPKLICGNQAK